MRDNSELHIAQHELLDLTCLWHNISEQSCLETRVSPFRTHCVQTITSASVKEVRWNDLLDSDYSTSWAGFQASFLFFFAFAFLAFFAASARAPLPLGSESSGTYSQHDMLTRGEGCIGGSPFRLCVCSQLGNQLPEAATNQTRATSTGGTVGVPSS